jgi:hypothetical protein
LYEYLTYIDFGEKANRFLLSCGVKNEPSPIEFAELLVKSSHELWDSTGRSVENYLDILRRIAIDFDTISNKKPSLIAEMKREPILLAKVVEYNSRRKTNHYELKPAGKVFINDSQTYQKIFNPSVAPEEILLEKMYEVCRLLLFYCDFSINIIMLIRIT